MCNNSSSIPSYPWDCASVSEPHQSHALAHAFSCSHNCSIHWERAPEEKKSSVSFLCSTWSVIYTPCCPLRQELVELYF